MTNTISNIKHVKDNKYNFILTTRSTTLANDIRRYVYTKIETMAIDTVILDVNTSKEVDEMLASRLGFIVLEAKNIDSFVDHETCECKEYDKFGCSKCGVFLDLNIEANNEILVKAEHLIEPSKKIKIILPKQEICILKKNQKIKLTCFAIKGTGEKNIKWSPVCLFTCKRVKKIPGFSIKDLMNEYYIYDYLIELELNGSCSFDKILSIIKNEFNLKE